MAFERKFPWTNFQELNLNWFIRKWEDFKTDWATAKAELESTESTLTQAVDDKITEIDGALADEVATVEDLVETVQDALAEIEDAIATITDKLDKSTSTTSGFYYHTGDGSEILAPSPLSVAFGGTGGSIASQARTNLGAEASENKTDDLSTNYASTTYFPTCNAVVEYVSGRITTLQTLLNNAISTGDTYTLGQAKSYADTQDGLTLASAKSYSNSQNSAMKTYVDTQDGNTLNSAKSYTDAKDGAMKTYVDTQDTSTLNTAKGYTDAKDSAMKTYVDTQDALKVDKTTTVNGKALSADVTLTAEDIGYTASGEHTENSVGEAITETNTTIGDLSTLTTTAKNNLVSAINEVAETGGGSGNSAPLIYNTASGAVATFPDGADDLAVKSLIANITPVQSGSGDPAPDNVRPITGWTGCNVYRIGKNTLPFPYTESTLTRWGVSFTVNSDGTILVNGTAEGADASFTLCNSLPYAKEVVQGKSLRLTGCPSGGSDSTYYLQNSITGHKDVGNGVTIGNFNPSHYRYTIMIKEGTTANNLLFKPMVTINDNTSTYNSYEPYKANTITVDWTDEAGTVYGGTFNPITGKLTVTHRKVVLDGTQEEIDGENWRPQSNSVGWYYNYFPEDAVHLDIAELVNGFSDTLKAVSYNTIYSNDISSFAMVYTSNLIRLCVRITDTTLTTVALINAYLAENPITIVYPLATPIEYTLTAQQIKTLYATNNIWGDTGSIASVTYPADTKLYIDNAIASAIASI